MPLTIMATMGVGIGSGYLVITAFLNSFGRHKRPEQAAPATRAIEAHATGD